MALQRIMKPTLQPVQSVHHVNILERRLSGLCTMTSIHGKLATLRSKVLQG